jgi:hypothetical protein
MGTSRSPWAQACTAGVEGCRGRRVFACANRPRHERDFQNIDVAPVAPASAGAAREAMKSPVIIWA